MMAKPNARYTTSTVTVRAEDADTSASNRKFVGGLGHPTEGETGLIYMRARYMDPETGRFVSEDPAKNGANWFVYCNDDPTNKVDQNGKEGEAWAGLIAYLVWLVQNLAQDKYLPATDLQVLALGQAAREAGLLLITNGRVAMAFGSEQIEEGNMMYTLPFEAGSTLALRAYASGIGYNLYGAGSIAAGVTLQSIATVLLGLGAAFEP